MPTVTEIIDSFQASYGFDPSGIYCSATGKRVGSTHIEELESLINLIGGDTAEEIADDIGMRLLASMRPSMKWNKFRAESLAQMRRTDPAETLAYLINRMFAPLNHRKIGIVNLVATYADKVRAFDLISSWGVNDGTNTLMYMLLELDAKWNLDTETPPFSWSEFFLAPPSMQHRVDLLQHWYANRMEAWDKRLKAEELQTRWMRHGSALAKPAFMDIFMESKPLTVTAIKAAEKKVERDLFAGLLWEIMGKPKTPEELAAEQPRPTFVAIRKMPMKFGVKRNG